MSCFTPLHLTLLLHPPLQLLLNAKVNDTRQGYYIALLLSGLLI